MDKRVIEIVAGGPVVDVGVCVCTSAFKTFTPHNFASFVFQFIHINHTYYRLFELNISTCGGLHKTTTMLCYLIYGA